MNDDYKLKARYTKILTAKDLADRFSSDTQFKSKYKALSTSTLYNLLETLVSNNYISYNYLKNVLPNHYSIENNSETEFILSDYPFTSSFTYFDSYGRYVTLESTSPVNLTMKKTSSDTNVLDLEYPSNKTFILYTFGTKRYNANRDTEGTIFYYFTDEHNPIVDGKCIIISNNKSSGLSKAVGELPSSEDRTDSFLDPHANNLVYKSDLVTYAKDTGWITSTTTSSNGVCTYNAGNAGGELQIRKIGKIAYLNLALRLDLSIDTAIDGQYLLTLNEKYRPIQTIYFTTLLTCRDTSECNQLCTVAISPDGKVKLPNHIEIARKQIENGSQSLYLNHLVSYPV